MRNYVGEINIGTGIETDVVTIFQHLRQAVGSKIERDHGPAKPGEQRRSCIDAASGRASAWLASHDGAH